MLYRWELLAPTWEAVEYSVNSLLVYKKQFGFKSDMNFSNCGLCFDLKFFFQIMIYIDILNFLGSLV